MTSSKDCQRTICVHNSSGFGRVRAQSKEHCDSDRMSTVDWLEDSWAPWVVNCAPIADDRYSSYLPKALRLGFLRRCLLASASALLTSRLDFLQGTFEKIQLQGLLNQQALQLVDFLAESGFRRFSGWRIPARIEGTKLIPLFVKKTTMYTKFLRQLHDVVAGSQPLDSHPAEFFRNPPHSSLCHLQCLSLQSVPYPSVSS